MKLHSPLNKKLISLALPVVIGMMSITAVLVADSAMVGRLGTMELAAAGVGGMAYWTISSLVLGASYGVQILVARRFGERNFSQIHTIAATASFLFLILSAVLSALLLSFSKEIMFFFSKNPQVIHLGDQYLYYRSLGTIPFFLGFALRAFFDGLGKTYVGMIASFSTAFINIFLNYILIFGHLGFPAWGIKGAALASAWSSLFGFLIYLLILFHRENRKYFFGPRFHVSREIIKKIIALGMAPSLSEGVQNMAFLVFMRIAGFVGAVSQASSNIMFSVLSISFMPGFAFSIASTTIVSQSLGQKKFKLAELGSYKAMRFAAYVMGFMGLAFIISGEYLLSLFTKEQEVIEESFWPLIIVSVVQIFDATHMVLSGSLRGAGLVNWILAMYTSVSWLVMVPLAYFFTQYMNMGSKGLWLAVSIWMVILAVSTFLKFRSNSWKTKEF